MKTKFNYRKHFTFAYVLLIISVIFCGCEEESIKREPTPIVKIYPIIDKIEDCDDDIKFMSSKRIRNIRVYEIDSCEYIGHINVFNSDFLAHKGNCKFCVERGKK